MKFVTVTYGTEGDTRPLAALCRALIDAGHTAHLLADAATLGSAEALGVPATGLAGDIKGAMRAAGAMIGRGQGGFGDTARVLSGIANANTESWLRATVTAAAGGCDAVILSGLAAFVGLSAAEYLRVPAIGTGLIPITPTRAFASPFLPPGMVPGLLNRASHHLVNQVLWRSFRDATNAARASVCRLPPRKKLWTEHPMLYGVSPGLLPRPDDWPANADVCGQWVVKQQEWSPPPSLAAFLAAGAPPVYIGFGSMPSLGGRNLLGEVVAAVGGRRALFYPGWSGVGGGDLPENFHVIGDTPHDWLFPKTALAIHHGGAGTTHSAARAGVPSVVVPFAADQFFWAERLRRAGVAPPPLPAKHLKAPALARSIAAAESAEMRTTAAALGVRMAAENGLADTVTAIEALLLNVECNNTLLS
jgi:sterol 3beta-glucosyltransferase